ncbi:hypothetical protein ACRAWD_20450 [Caulobacter segnis]
MITPADAEAMKAAGVAAVFRAGARDHEIVEGDAAADGGGGVFRRSVSVIGG